MRLWLPWWLWLPVMLALCALALSVVALVWVYAVLALGVLLVVKVIDKVVWAFTTPIDADGRPVVCNEDRKDLK